MSFAPRGWPTGISIIADAFARAGSDRAPHAVPRGDRGMLHSAAPFDLDAPPVTIAPPGAGERFMSPIVVERREHLARRSRASKLGKILGLDAFDPACELRNRHPIL